MREVLHAWELMKNQWPANTVKLERKKKEN